MAHIFKLLSPIQKLADDGDTLKIAGYASTVDTDRVGDVIVPDAWSKGGLENYQKNPIILFNHNYGKPIGKAVELEVDGRGLKITCEISKSAGDTYGLIKDEVLRTFSVGFMIKDADYNQATDGYIIREAELYEVSVVSVPCNQEAVFSVSKSLEPKELEEFKRKTLNGESIDEVNASANKPPKTDAASASPEKKTMNEEEIAALVQKTAAEAIAKHEAAQKAALEAEAREKAQDERVRAASEAAAKATAEAVTKTVEEKLLGTFEEKLKANNEDWQKTVTEMKTDLESKKDELTAMYNSKRNFSDRSGGGDENLLKNKDFLDEAKDAFVFAKIKKAAFGETKLGKALVEKFNTHSTVTVGDDALETTVGTDIERDIWNELILAPLFREVRMNSATMTFPIMPDAGYAEATTNTTAAGSQPNGNVDQRGAGYGAPYQGITLSNQTLTTTKLISKAYLGNETEEDTIIPILPLIRESMTRSHARSVENMILAGNHADGVYTSGVANGLLSFAATNSRTVTAAALTTKLTGAGLFGLRKLMGKYGLNARDIVYVVSQQAYFELIEDAEFADVDLVGAAANKLTGEVGRIYGSSVIMCDEFATPAANKYFALALNRRNFIIPRLRGVTVESEYQVENQRLALVTSQRLGFSEIIPNALSIVGLKYPAS